ncbi:MAG: LPS-assembly protein LptD [Candidatus Aminicenantales bacterium]
MQDASQTAPQSTSPQTAPQTIPPVPPQKSVAEAPPPPIEPPAKVIKADHWEKVNNIITATGNVEIRYREIILYADHAVYDETTKDVTADGHVSVIQSGDAFTAEHLAFNLESGLGKADKVTGLVQPQYRYESSVLERKTPDLFDLGKCRITGCSQPVPRWEFSASQATFLRHEYVEMWNPILRIKNVPVLYLPYLKYPLNQQRATGFLMPAIGYSPRKGFTLTQQFYLTLARNMDATFSLDYYSTKGFGGGLEYRYLFGAGSGGKLNAYYFAYNTPTTGVKPDNAVILRWQHSETFPGKIKFVAAVDYQNSFAFSREFDNNYARALVYNRSSQIYVTKSWAWANISARLGRFDTTYTTAGLTLIRESLPQISFSTYKKKLLGPVFFSLGSTYNNWAYGTSAQFDKNSEKKSSELNFKPILNLPINTIPWFTINLTASGHVSYYGNSYDPINKKTTDRNLLSGNYTLSAAFTGPIFYRIFTLAKTGTKIKHLIEPNIIYNFDSPTLNAKRIVTLFGLYRYHYVSFGLTNHLLMKKKDPKAKTVEIFTWGISQYYYFDPSQSPLSRYKLGDGTIPRFSDLSSYVRFFPVGDFNFDFRAGYNVYKKALSSVRASANLGTAADDLYFSFAWYKSINPYYSQTVYSNREQIGINGGVKISNLDLSGDFQYNIQAKKMLYADLAVAWDWQCLNFKVDAQAFFFRTKPEVQFRFSVGLGNITSSSNSLGSRNAADNTIRSSEDVAY